jgi:hypothetical protein
VLYPAPLRDILIELAATGLFRARWTDRIHEEWIGNLLHDRTDLKREQLERTRDLMNRAGPDCLIVSYEDLIDAVDLPDPDDRHVLAAAIRGGCRAIITTNLKDIPPDTLLKYDVEAQHPDEFIHSQFDVYGASVVIAAQRCRSRLLHPPRTAKDYIGTLKQIGLVLTAADLYVYEDAI